METRKVLVIGLDGATFDILRPLMDKGYMPNLHSIANQGVVGPLRSTILPGTPIAWSSMITGMKPGNHGIYEFVARRQGTYDLFPLDASHRKSPDLWEYISRAGLKVGVVNVPFTFPPRKVNGYMITGLFTPHVGHHFVYPPDLLKELERAIGKYQLFPKETYYPGGETSFLQDLYAVTENRLEATRYLLRNKPWDFFMVVFNGTDRIQHAFWRHIDKAHPKWDPKCSPAFASAFYQYFARVDQIIGEIVEQAEENTTVFIVSDHGMRTLHKFIHINNYLLRMGLLRLKKNFGTRLRYALFRAGVTPENLFRILLKLRLGRFRHNIDKEDARNLLRRLFLSFDDVDWLSTRVYQLVGGHIYLNLKGREPNGIVDPEDEAKHLSKTIINWLLKLRDPDNGAKLIEAVFDGRTIYTGKCVEQAPDIVFLPASPYGRFTEYEFASNRLTSEPTGISGTHHIDGVLFMKGPGIKQSATIQGAEIQDIAPTILYCMGLPIPREMDGKVLSNAFTEEFVSSNPPRFVAYSEGARVQRVLLSKEDEARIKERLRQLGYLG